MGPVNSLATLWIYTAVLAAFWAGTALHSWKPIVITRARFWAVLVGIIAVKIGIVGPSTNLLLMSALRAPEGGTDPFTEVMAVIGGFLVLSLLATGFIARGRAIDAGRAPGWAWVMIIPFAFIWLGAIKRSEI